MARGLHLRTPATHPGMCATTSAAATIRSCTRAHVLGLCLLNVATFPPSTEQPRPTRALPRVAASWYHLQKRLHLNHVLVAMDESDSIVGSVEVHTAAYMLSQPKNNLTQEQADVLQPYLASLAVRDDMRGRGIGKALVQAALDEARAVSQRPDEHLLLQVEASNVPALRLYERCGFKVISAPGCQIAVMRRRLHERAARAPSTPPASSVRASWLDGGGVTDEVT